MGLAAIIRSADAGDLAAILEIHRTAFGEDDEADLVAALLQDDSAMPLISLLAESAEGDPIGHILLTAARIEGSPPAGPVMLLAPLAVAPDAQSRGVGADLMTAALEVAATRHVSAVFVLGHPGYYPKHGFTPAGALGFDAPYPIQAENAGAWMVIETTVGSLKGASGRVVVADALMKPEYWRE